MQGTMRDSKGEDTTTDHVLQLINTKNIRFSMQLSQCKYIETISLFRISFRGEGTVK